MEEDEPCVDTSVRAVALGALTLRCDLPLQVLVVPLLAGATGKADVKPLTYVSALMALAGVGLLVEQGGVIMPNSGDFWSLASAVFFGIQVRTSCWCNVVCSGLLQSEEEVLPVFSDMQYGVLLCVMLVLLCSACPVPSVQGATQKTLTIMKCECEGV